MKRLAFAAFGFLVLAGMIGFVVTSGGGLGGSSDSAAPAARTAGGLALGGLDVVSEAGVPAPADLSGGSSEIAQLGALPAIGPDIVKTAEISLTVKENGFNEAFGTAAFIASKYGGYVQSSSSTGVKVQSGTLLIRVPSASFDGAMSDLSGLGVIAHQSVSGEDVTSQYVDLQARLITWEAQESVLLKLMGSAHSIEATLRVQRELQDVQFRIEQIKGQLRLLDNQTSLATIRVSLREPGAPIGVAGTAKANRPSLMEAWDRSVNGFLGVVSSVVVGLGYLVPLSLLLGLGWLGWRRLRPGHAVI
jgi:hypothetical protein